MHSVPDVVSIFHRVQWGFPLTGCSFPCAMDSINPDGDFGSSGLPPALPDKESRHTKPPPPPKPASSTFGHNNKGGHFVALFPPESFLSHGSVPGYSGVVGEQTDIHPRNVSDVGITLSPEMCTQLRQLRRHTKELRAEVRNLRRMAQAQAAATREAVKVGNDPMRKISVRARQWVPLLIRPYGSVRGCRTRA